MVGLDVPFFKVIGVIYHSLEYFQTYAKYIARILLLLSLCFGFLKYIMTGEGLRDFLMKQSMSLMIYLILAASYEGLVHAIPDLAFKMANGTLGTVPIRDGVSNTFTGYLSDEADIVLMPKEVERPTSNSWDDAFETTNVIQLLKNVFQEGRAAESQELINKYQESKKFTQNNAYYDKETNYFTSTDYGFATPNALLTTAFAMVLDIERVGEKFKFPQDLMLSILMIFAMLAVIVCSIFGVCEYLICCIEFSMVSSVGVILLPTMLWDGSKFLTEKLISTIIGFFLKLLFCTFALFIMFWGFLDMMRSAFLTDGTADLLKFVFQPILYFLIVKAAPNLATSLLTGSPSMSFGGAVGAVAGAAGAVAGAAKLSGKVSGAVAGKTAQGVNTAVNTGAQALAAGNAALKSGGKAGDALAAVGSSLGSSAVSGIGTGASNLAHSLLGNKKDSGGRKDEQKGIRETYRESVQKGADMGKTIGQERKHTRFNEAVAGWNESHVLPAQSEAQANAGAVSYASHRTNVVAQARGQAAAAKAQAKYEKPLQQKSEAQLNAEAAAFASRVKSA